MEPRLPVELPFWPNLILAALVVGTLLWCAVDVYRALRKR